jgi:hypothetical protein
MIDEEVKVEVPDGRILTPLRAVRARCIDCAGSRSGARRCPMTDCTLHHLRMGSGSRAVLRPIRHHCLWCCAGSVHEVRLCPSAACPLYAYRMGRRPSTRAGSVVENGLEEGRSGMTAASGNSNPD